MVMAEWLVLHYELLVANDMCRFLCKERKTKMNERKERKKREKEGENKPKRSLLKGTGQIQKHAVIVGNKTFERGMQIR